MESNKAQKSNPALEPFAVLVGEWRAEGTHPYVPDKTLQGKASFEWICGGAFLLWRSEISNDSRFPSGVAIFGSDNAEKKYFMLYFDERGVSRKYDVSYEKNVLTWWRDDSDFSQRMVLTIAEDGRTIVSKGEMRKSGGAWEPDLALTYTRLT
jgi:hypothetical protein